MPLFKSPTIQTAFAEGSTSSPTTTSSSDSTISEMTLSVTSLGGTWLIDFSGLFRHSTTTNLGVFKIKVDGTEKGQSYRELKAPVAATNYLVHTMWLGTIPAGSATITVTWQTDGGTLTAFSTKRQLRAFELNR